jgi:hypothetical protein
VVAKALVAVADETKEGQQETEIIMLLKKSYSLWTS